MPVESTENGGQPAASREGRTGFLLSAGALILASVFAGAMLRPLIERWLRPAVPGAAELALLIEHAAVDVRLGRVTPLVERLGSVAQTIQDRSTKERVLGLLTEASLQAGRLSEAARTEEQREPLLDDPAARSATRLRRIGLAAALGESARAGELAQPLISGRDPLLADEARLRLMAGMTEADLRARIASSDGKVPEESRRWGLAALRLLGDAAHAERLLAPLIRSDQRDTSLLAALADVYSRLERHREVAFVAEGLLRETADESERARLGLLRADALARAGDTDDALAALEPFRTARDFSVRQQVRRSRYEVLQRAGRLRGELAALRDPAERAFVALEIERDYVTAARLYESVAREHPNSVELAEGLREAQRRQDLAERRILYEQVLAKDPDDGSTREKLLAVLVALGDEGATRRWIADSLRGRKAGAEELVRLAVALSRAGLDRDAARYLEHAYASTDDGQKKQQILFSLGDLYAESRREEEARRLYANLATEGVNPEIRERAVARLASMLR